MHKIKKLLNNQISITLIAVIIGFIISAIVLWLTGYNPIEVFTVLFQGMFSKPKYIMNIIIKATPIILTGISVAFAFKVGLLNIGSEGQYVVGTTAAVVVGIVFDLPAIIQFPLILISGALAGGLYGALSGYLKAKFEINEVITGIMLNWVAFYGCNYIITGEKFHQPNSSHTLAINSAGLDPIYNWKTSEAGKAFVLENPLLREIIGGTTANTGIIFAIVIALFVTWLLTKTTKGYELRAVGFNKHASEFVGIDIKKNTIQTLFIAGAIAGLSGALSITGVSQRMYEMMAPENYGFNGLTVALMAGSSPIGCIFSGLLFAGLTYGGGSIQSRIGAPSEIIDIMIGTIVFFTALTKLVPMVLNKLSKRGGRKVAK